MSAHTREEAAELAAEALSTATRHIGHARIVALWAGVTAERAGMTESENPFTTSETLHAAWRDGFAMGLRAPLPKAEIIRLPTPRRTHASATHEAMP